MRRCSLNKLPLLVAALLCSLLLAISAVPLLAQPTNQAHPFYDVRNEVTLSGTVATVLEKAAPGMAWGSHLVLDTPSGKVDASLGRWGLAGKDALSVTPGQQVEVTGIMKGLKDKPVFVVRTVKVNGRIYTIRNQHGAEMSPQTRKIAAEKGVTL